MPSNFAVNLKLFLKNEFSIKKKNKVPEKSSQYFNTLQKYTFTDIHLSRAWKSLVSIKNVEDF